MKIDVGEMTLEQINEECAFAQGWSRMNGVWLIEESKNATTGAKYRSWYCKEEDYTPTTDSKQAMDLMKAFNCGVAYIEDGLWMATVTIEEPLDVTIQYGDTPELAISKAVVKVYMKRMVGDK